MVLAVGQPNRSIEHANGTSVYLIRGGRKSCFRKGPVPNHGTDVNPNDLSIFTLIKTYTMKPKVRHKEYLFMVFLRLRANPNPLSTVNKMAALGSGIEFKTRLSIAK